MQLRVDKDGRRGRRAIRWIKDVNLRMLWAILGIGEMRKTALTGETDEFLSFLIRSTDRTVG